MDRFTHIRIILAMIVSLGIAQLLRGISGLVQHPGRRKVYWLQLMWMAFLFLYILHFWWWEFSLRSLAEWSFPIYAFVILYSVLLYLLCTLFSPDNLAEYAGFRDYFYSRRVWIFALMLLLFVVDLGDTWLKGMAYVDTLGRIYAARTALLILGSAAALVVQRPRFHAFLAVGATTVEAVYILIVHRVMQ